MRNPFKDRGAPADTSLEPDPGSPPSVEMRTSPASIFAVAGNGENTPLNLAELHRAPTPARRRPRGGGRSCARSSAWSVVLGVIYGLTWVLKKVKSRQGAGGLGRRASRRSPRCRSAPTARCTWCAPAREVVLLGVGRARRRRRSAASPRPRRRSSACSTARRAPRSTSCADARRRRAPADRRRPDRRAARQDGGQVTDATASNAVQLLLLVGGISLVPAAAVHGHGLHPDPDRPRLHPPGPRHADGAAEPGAGRHRVLPDAVRDEPDAQADQARRLRPAAEGPDHADRRAQARRGPAARVHVQADARPRTSRCSSSSAQLKNVKTRADVPTLGPDPGVHDLRAQDGLPDRLPDLPAVPDHRPRRLLDADVDGDDDAAAGLHLAAVQDPAVRPGRRLEPRHVVARSELPHHDARTVVSLVVSMMGYHEGRRCRCSSSASSSACVISVFQAVTQIQEQTLSFIPKVLALVAVVAIAGPWMLDTLVDWTHTSSGPRSRRRRCLSDDRQRAPRSRSPSSRSRRSSWCSRGSRRCSCSRRCSRRKMIPRARAVDRRGRPRHRPDRRSSSTASIDLDPLGLRRR